MTINNPQLDSALRAAGIPIVGVGTNEDGSTRIDFQAEATDEQRAQALVLADPKTLQAAIDAEAAAQAKAEAAGQLAVASADATLSALPANITTLSDADLRKLIVAIAQQLGLAKADGTLIQ